MQPNLHNVILDDLSVEECSEADIQRVKILADQVWKPTFSKILSPDRLDYLYRLMYSDQKLFQQVTDPKNSFYILTFRKKDVGYAHLVFENEWVKLEKLYILDSMQGKGCGLYLLRTICTIAANQPQSELRLQVNRQNLKAISFYRKFGFETLKAHDFDVGGGHFMEDYVMVYNLKVLK